MPRDAKLSIVCLGTGKSASMVYDGGCSPGYVLCADDRPVILFGAGYGVTRQCLRYFDRIPSNIFLFSNRSYMSAELPVIIAVESRGGRCLRIISSETVMPLILEHRLAELRVRIDSAAVRGKNMGDFVALTSLKDQFLANSSPYVLPDFISLSLVVFDTPATEASCGVCVLHNGNPVLALTGDCAYNAQLHRKILCMAPVVIFDGRRNASPDHASFVDVIHAVKTCRAPLQRVFIGQYGQPCEAPPMEKDSVVCPIVEGAVVKLGKKITVTNALATEEENVSLLIRPRNVNTHACLGGQAKKVFVINNESPEDSKALLMVQHFRTMTQVKQRISELLCIRPVGDIFCAETGHKLKDITQLEHGMQIVATKIGGRPFSFVNQPLQVGKQLAGVVMQKKSFENAAVSLELHEYLQRVYHVLGKDEDYAGIAVSAKAASGENCDADDGTVAVAFHDSFEVDTCVNLSPVNTVEASPEVVLSNNEKRLWFAKRGGSDSSGTASCLRFTTLKT